MPDYKETTITGKQWNRFGDVYAFNPLVGQKHIIYGEQAAQTFSTGKTTMENLSGIKKKYSPGETFPLINPETGEVLRQVTEAELYAMMASHAMYVAGLRDTGSPTVQRVEYPRVTSRQG